jgi:type IV pilus biogenesis protein CpaD/CtpE
VTRQISALWIAAALLALPLVGCEHSLVGQNMGNAHRENMNAQIADPEAGRANEPGPEGMDGMTAEDVMDRYHRAQGGARTPSMPAIVSTGVTR